MAAIDAVNKTGPNSFEIITLHRTWYFQTESETDLDYWIEGLKHCRNSPLETYDSKFI